MPVKNPKSAITNITIFLEIKNPFAPFESPHAITISITGGNTRAKAVEQRAPMSDIKRLSLGTPWAIATEMII